MTRLIKRFFKLVLVVYVFFLAYGLATPTPVEKKSPHVFLVQDNDVHFFADETYLDSSGKRVVKQEIWDTIFTTISNAHQWVFLDMFLFNDFQGGTPETTRPLSQELTKSLVSKKISDPHIAIAVMSDPINTVYGGLPSPYFNALRDKGVSLMLTDLTLLRDSNPLWSAFWRPFVRIWGNSSTGGHLPHPFQSNGEKVTLRSWLSLLNFKANHRKVLVADAPVINNNKEVGRTIATVITSGNPHDGSSAHGNIALKVDRQVWSAVILDETEVAKQSGFGLPSFGAGFVDTSTGTIRATYLHEKEIRTSVLDIIARSKRDDSINLEMFYLSERSIVRALIAAANRGVHIMIILDPNKDAFGHEKNGIPNRPVAKELTSGSAGDIQIRWCDTHGEQCHAKLFMGKIGETSFLMVGSANFTRRNIGGFNLESNILIESEREYTAWKEAQEYFARLWNNTGGTYTTPYETYQDKTIWKSSVYRMMERTGLSSF